MSDTLAVIPAYMRRKEDAILTENAIRSLLDTSDADLMVVDDHSPEAEFSRRIEGICNEVGADFQYRAENYGFTSSVNLGIKHARKTDRHALLVNADIQFVEQGWLDHMRENPADVVGALLLYPNGLCQHAGIYWSVITRKFDHMFRLAPGTLAQVNEPRICPVTGALQLIKNETIKKIGIYDENFKLGFEDVDYCMVAFEEGLTCAYEPKAKAVHFESVFRTNNDNPSERHIQWMNDGWIHFHEKHRGREFSEFTPTMIWDFES